ncbi:putative phosphoglycerate mutase [Pararhizobium capsulatum DSM 1112]|uniref:Phosphoglycerate mutase n=1 Tax=Pararhizobium capsulatum DSM 1112 TaxID=1121113 RepID=A0ABU0C283_9HYPH|nr:histidine phosphatase family protein [Pararhizobium capsulatum]MDQ0323780.1 putative phosphoglycerate mutase [Pararhizobium capsulatum DSM 1112]
MRVLLVRHGQSEWNAEKRLQGQADIGLSEKGVRQAETLRPVIDAINPCRTITSDLRRARHTAAILGFSDAEPLEGLREISVGEWTGRSIPDIIAEDAQLYSGWRAGSHTPPQGETWVQFVARTRAVIEHERLKPDCRNLLVVCHGGVIRALLDHYIGLQPAHIIPVGPASLTALRLSTKQEEPVKLELFNYSPGNLQFDAPD